MKLFLKVIALPIGFVACMAVMSGADAAAVTFEGAASQACVANAQGRCGPTGTENLKNIDGFDFTRNSGLLYLVSNVEAQTNTHFWANGSTILSLSGSAFFPNGVMTITRSDGADFRLTGFDWAAGDASGNTMSFEIGSFRVLGSSVVGGRQEFAVTIPSPSDRTKSENFWSTFLFPPLLASQDATYITIALNGRLDRFSMDNFELIAVPLPPALVLFVSIALGFGALNKGKKPRRVMIKNSPRAEQLRTFGLTQGQ